MTDRQLSAFASPTRHETITGLIRRLSSNRSDIRDLACAGLNLAAVHDILDLGCGFGFMSEKVLPQTAPDARLLGVDAWEENRSAFLQTVSGSGRKTEFQTLKLGRELPWPSRSFDLVLASYSLYFFVEALPEISRVLRPAGLFLAVTHSQESFRGLCRLAGLDEQRSPLPALIRNFSAENGAAVLSRHFAQVEQIDYANELEFAPRHQQELQQYVEFKLPLLTPESTGPEVPPADLAQRVAEALRRDGGFVMNKNDAIFRCRQPKTS